MLAALTFLVYSGILFPGFWKLWLGSAPWNYFRNFADAFSHGRLFLLNCPDGTNCHDLSIFNGRIYMYWPPVPALIYIPFIKIFGVNTPDHLINAGFGSLNVLLAFLLFASVHKRLGGYGLVLPVVFAFFYAFGTVHFYMSMDGNVWYISQVLAQTFVLAGLLVVSQTRSVAGLILSGFCFAMSCFTRNTMIFSLPVFLAVSRIPFQNISGYRWIKNWLLFLTPFVLFLIINGWYNYARFGSITDNGLQYHQMSWYFKDNYSRYGYFALHYLPVNAFRELIFPLKWQSAYPYFQFDEDGTGMFWVSSPFLLLFPAFIFILTRRNMFSMNDRRMTYACIISAVCTMILTFGIMGSGWRQFGARYMLDIHIFLLLPILIYLQKTKSVLCLGLFIVLAFFSVYIQLNGAKFYLGI